MFVPTANVPEKMQLRLFVAAVVQPLVPKVVAPEKTCPEKKLEIVQGGEVLSN